MNRLQHTLIVRTFGYYRPVFLYKCFHSWLVCLFVCQQDFSKCCQPIFMKLCVWFGWISWILTVILIWLCHSRASDSHATYGALYICFVWLMNFSTFLNTGRNSIFGMIKITQKLVDYILYYCVSGRCHPRGLTAMWHYYVTLLRDTTTWQVTTDNWRRSVSVAGTV